MKKTMAMLLAVLVMGTLAFAQPFQWPAEYAPTAVQGGNIQETMFSDMTTLQPFIGYGSATEVTILGLLQPPAIIYRDWLGDRSFRDEEGNYNRLFASEIEEVRFEQEFVITLREGATWSDGTPITAADFIAGYTILGDPAVEANEYVGCTDVDQQPMMVEQLGTYQYRLTLREAVPNALNAKGCQPVPAHVFMPVYEAEGAAGIRALYGVDTDPRTIVSGGPYLLREYVPGQRLVLERNPAYGEMWQAADGSPLPGPDTWTVTVTEDRNAELALVVTGQADFYWPTTLDEVRAVQDAVNRGVIPGSVYPNIGPSLSVDFMTYNFNNTNECKRNMFRQTEFRQAISMMIDRDALVEAAVGGLGFPARNYSNDGLPPFNAPNVPQFEFDPQGAVALLNAIGFTEEGPDGVLRNPTTGCRVSFDLQFNSGNNRRAQLALVTSQIAAEYGVEINVREVSVDIWTNSIIGDVDYDETGQRTVDYDAQIWGLTGGDIDNPHSSNVLGINQNLNNWNKSRENVEPWEVLLDRLSRRMENELELDARVAIHQERAALMREQLPITPLISASFHFFENLDNVWPVEAMDAASIQSPYNPGNFRPLLTNPAR